MMQGLRGHGFYPTLIHSSAKRVSAFYVSVLRRKNMEFIRMKRSYLHTVDTYDLKRPLHKSTKGSVLFNYSAISIAEIGILDALIGYKTTG
jgi:hypothetical protein